MRGISQPILRTLPSRSAFPKALILGIALASNIGGLASPISSPQNLIALEYMDPPISWLGWFSISIPVSFTCVVLIWCILLWTYRSGNSVAINPVRVNKEPFTKKQWFVSIVTIATIILWCVESKLEGVFGDMGIIAILPIVAFYGSGVLRKVRRRLSPPPSFLSPRGRVPDVLDHLPYRPTSIIRPGRSSSWQWAVSRSARPSSRPASSTRCASSRSPFPLPPLLPFLPLSSPRLRPCALNSRSASQSSRELTLSLPRSDAVIQDVVLGMDIWPILALFSVIVLVIGTFISHTIAAVLVVPIASTIGNAMDSPHPRLLILATAMICSAGMGLPVSGFPVSFRMRRSVVWGEQNGGLTLLCCSCRIFKRSFSPDFCPLLEPHADERLFQQDQSRR